MKARKEVTLAVIIGLIVGLVIMGGVLRARRALEQIELPRPASSPEATPAPQSDALTLTVETADHQVTNLPSLTVSGKTSPKAYIVILGEADEHILVPTAQGLFSQEIKLVAGANTIKITSYLEDGTKVEKTLVAVYTTSEI